LPLSADWREIHAAGQARDPASILNLYRALIELRRREPALSTGSYATLAATGQVLAYQRQAGSRRLGVALNLTGEAAELWDVSGRVLISTNGRSPLEAVQGVLALGANESVVFEIN
jgi:alpha-glucosidase